MASWRSRRDYLCRLIKKVSEENGGDDREWLKDYAKDVIKKYAEDLEVPIRCFESLVRKEAKCVIEPLSHRESGGALMGN